MKVLVVDDEPLAREWLQRLMVRMNDVRLCGEASSGVEALEKARALDADVVLLDIHIPGKDGLEVARELGETPIIFTTAHGRYAVDAFELDACDYLLKPIRYEQLARALERARRRRALQETMRHEVGEPASSVADDETIVVSERGVALFVKVRRITRFRAADKYTLFQVDGVEHLIRDSLETLEARLGAFGFLRVHRAELVRRDAVVSLAAEGAGARIELIDGQQVAVSRRYLSATKRALGLR
jgi:DNA-binding LytR/AlgR family response regulator